MALNDRTRTLSSEDIIGGELLHNYPSKWSINPSQKNCSDTSQPTVNAGVIRALYEQYMDGFSKRCRLHIEPDITVDDRAAISQTTAMPLSARNHKLRNV